MTTTGSGGGRPDRSFVVPASAGQWTDRREHGPPEGGTTNSAPAEVRGVAGWPLPLPTRRAAQWIAAAALPVVAATWWAPAVWIGAVVFAVTIVLVVADFLAVPPAEAFEARPDGSGVLPLGTETEIRVLLRRRDRGGRTLTMEVVDDLAPTLLRTADPSPFELRADSEAAVVTRVRPVRRSRIALGPVHARIAGPFGVASRQVRFELVREVRVLPGITAVADAARLLRRGLRREAGRRQIRRRGEGTAFESLREYVRGDDPRRLDWKASARHGKLIARQYEVERNRTVLLMIDCGRWMTADVGGLTRLDRVLDAAVLLAHVAALRDDRIGVLAFSDRIEAYVPPFKGRAAVERIVDATLGVEPRLVESDYGRAFSELAARHRKRSLVILFTDVLSKDASRIVAEEARRQSQRHAVLLVTLRDPEIDALADAVPANASAAYEQAAAEDLLLDRDGALSRMHRDGLHLLDIDPRRLGPALVDRYLDLKARLVV